MPSVEGGLLLRSSSTLLQSAKKNASEDAFKPKKINHTRHGQRLRAFVHPMGSLLGVQIYYDNYSKSKLDPGWNPYFNRKANVFMESQVITDVIDDGYHEFADYFGVFSWKLSYKHHTDSQWIFNTMVEDRFRNDLYLFPVARRARSVWHNEPQMRLAIAGEIVMRKIGLNVDLMALRTRVIVANHFICRSEIYEEYQRDFLKPCLEVMRETDDPALRSILSKDSGHLFSDRILNRVKSIYGVDYYSLQPFVAEQLFATWWALKESDRQYRTFVLPPRDPAHPPIRLDSIATAISMPEH
jgi:hypothetical protein